MASDAELSVTFSKAAKGAESKKAGDIYITSFFASSASSKNSFSILFLFNSISITF